MAAFDNDLAKIGKTWEGVTIKDVKQLSETVKSEEIRIGIVSVPAASAQEVTNALYENKILPNIADKGYNRTT